jgi:hypothetical protein
MSHDVFISYPSENKPIADAICNTLEKKRIRCWMAPRDILPGQNYAKALYDAIDQSRVFILVFSENTNNSPHIMSEVQRAFNNNCIIIPFRTENILPSTALQYYIGTAHWLDAITPPLEEKIEKLAATVHTFLTSETGIPPEPPVPPEPPTPPKPPEKPEPRGTSTRTIILLAVSVIGILLAAVIISPFLLQNSGQKTSPGTPVPTTNPGGVLAGSTAGISPVATPVTGAPPDVSGSWTGTFLSDSLSINYDASMDFTQSGNQIQGRFKYWDRANHLNYVVLSLSGHIENNELFITNSQLIEYAGFLSARQYNVQMWFALNFPQVLSGRWNGESSRGTISLTRKV